MGVHASLRFWYKRGLKSEGETEVGKISALAAFSP